MSEKSSTFAAVNLKNVILGSIAALGFVACTPAVREARDVVAQADSLRAEGRMYGIDEGDSASIAKAYETLQAWRVCYPANYAHACYHYGRLLRQKENPVEAMQVFINATHSHTRDYHILGRVYSNMGTICQLASSYTLSYKMYYISTNYFFEAGDSLLYYYGLKNMAFEKAMLADKTGVFELTNKIERECKDFDVITKVLETKAEVFLRTQQYDSARILAAELRKRDSLNIIGILVLAQSYSFTNNKDSASYYANMVLENSRELSEMHNALYILTNDDKNRSKEAIRQAAADRADIQKILKIRQGKLSQSVQLLELDINRKYDWTWLIAIVVTIGIITSIITIYHRYQRNKHKLLSQKVEDLSAAYSDIQSGKLANIERVCETLRSSPEFTRDICWRDYNKMCDIADNHFYLLTTKLKQKQILNEQEIRLCILVLINYNNNRIAQILSYAPSGVGKLKYRIAQKFGIEGKFLRKYLLSVAIDEPFVP